MQRTFAVMTNDVLISIPLFVFMGYLVERANLIEKLFKSLHLSLARVPGALAVATLANYVSCRLKPRILVVYIGRASRGQFGFCVA